MSLPVRNEIRVGMRVEIVEKQNQRTGVRTAGVVARLLTKSPAHPHGIKVMLEDGRVGRVKAVLSQRPEPRDAGASGGNRVEGGQDDLDDDDGRDQFQGQDVGNGY